MTREDLEKLELEATVQVLWMWIGRVHQVVPEFRAFRLRKRTGSWGGHVVENFRPEHEAWQRVPASLSRPVADEFSRLVLVVAAGKALLADSFTREDLENFRAALRELEEVE